LIKTRNLEAIILRRSHRSPVVLGDGDPGVLEYQPLSSVHLPEIKHPRCLGCLRSRMVLCAVAPGPSGFDIRTFECQKCGHVHMLSASQEPMASGIHGWPTSELNAPT
jgi:hypothetical protein